MAGAPVRFVAATIAAGAGWVAAMTALYLLHPRAFSTEIRWWATWSGVHAGLFWVTGGLWVAIANPDLSSWSRIGKALIASAFAGAGAAILPGMPGLLLILTGQAFITTTFATVAYVAMGPVWSSGEDEEE